MALTTEQLLLLNTLMYAKKPQIDDGNAAYQGQTVAEFIKNFDPSLQKDDIVTPEEWQHMKAQIEADPVLPNLVIKQSYCDAKANDMGVMFEIPGNPPEAVIAFRGTQAGPEWYDNSVAGGQVLSDRQQAALNWVKGMDLSAYDEVTTTGHSKGGNKAKIVALLDDRITDCESFNGQGFSDEFMREYESKIRQNQGKIHNHNQENDPVSPLLNDVGETTYYEGSRLDGNIFRPHSLTTFWGDDGQLHQCEPNERSRLMSALDYAVNATLRSSNAIEKTIILATLGRLLEAINTKNIAELTLVWMYIKATWPELYLVLAKLMYYANQYIELESQGLLDEFGSGNDIVYQTEQAFEESSSSNIIFVQFAEMSSTIAEMNRALELYNDALEQVKSAGEALCASWEGDAKEAFVIYQSNAYNWYSVMANVLMAVTQRLSSLLSSYQSMEDTVKSIVSGGGGGHAF